MADQQSGWYPDPSGDTTKLRYWNGTQWTDDFADAQPANTQPVDSTTYVQQPDGNSVYAQPTYGQPDAPSNYPQAQVIVNNNDHTLRLIAFILCIVSCVSLGWAIIPLAWLIPMTVRCWGIYQGTKPNTTAFGVCTLIFVSTIGGILLLVSTKEA